MKTLFMNAVGAIAISGALLAAVPAEARSGRHGGGGYRGNHGGNWSHGGNWGGRSHWGKRGYDRGRYLSYGRGYGHRGYRGYRGYYAPRYYGYAPAYYGYAPGYYGYGYGHGDDLALALGAGLLGVAVGSAIASDRGDGDRYYDDRGDYYDGYEYGD